MRLISKIGPITYWPDSFDLSITILIGIPLSLSSFEVSLRIQIHDGNKELFSYRTKERAFVDFLLSHLVLHLAVMNFLG